MKSKKFFIWCIFKDEMKMINIKKSDVYGQTLFMSASANFNFQ